MILMEHTQTQVKILVQNKGSKIVSMSMKKKLDLMRIIKNLQVKKRQRRDRRKLLSLNKPRRNPINWSWMYQVYFLMPSSLLKSFRNDQINFLIIESSWYSLLFITIVTFNQIHNILWLDSLVRSCLNGSFAIKQIILIVTCFGQTTLFNLKLLGKCSLIKKSTTSQECLSSQERII